MIRRAVGLAFLVSLCSFLPIHPAQAQCTPIDPQHTGVGSSGTIYLIYGGQNQLLSQGAAMWNDTCDSGIPDFQIRSQSLSGGINITIDLVNGTPSDCQPNQCACGNTIMVGGVATGGEIHIDTSCSKETVAHELGHVLGLTDTFNPSCVTRIMYGSSVPAGLATVEAGDCSAADGLWETPSEADPGEPVPPQEQDEGTPILVDLERNRFHLTGLADPVLFDIDADGDLEMLSWTSAGALDAFLHLDRNGNGVVDNGAELFGNVTPLIDGSTAENGYIPLAEFDLAALGGNGNGLIDSGDVIYPELQLWLDLDHNGISEPGELLSLADAGVTRLDLQYWTTRIHDGHGNYFRYISRAWILVNGREKRTWATDVFFVLGE